MCACTDFDDLEFLREEISKRIKASGTLLKELSLLAEHSGQEHKLYKCNVCGQLWQASRAWNWENDKYLFKVPLTSIESWTLEPYVQPDELLIFTAVMADFLTKNSFSENGTPCRVQGCAKSAVSHLGKCLLHHVEGLQKARTLPADPLGKWFEPYIRENIITVL